MKIKSNKPWVTWPLCADPVLYMGEADTEDYTSPLIFQGTLKR